jgi:hypothetical protein
VGSGWIGVDPTFGQTPVDATHIKLVEGEQLADLVPLLDWAGRVKIRVLAVEPPERRPGGQGSLQPHGASRSRASDQRSRN